MSLDLRRVIEFHRERRSLATFALRRCADNYSRIEIDAEARIRRMRLLRRGATNEFDDYPPALELEVASMLSAYMYSGAMVCEPAVLAVLPKVAPFNLMGDFFAPLVARDVPLFGYVDYGFFRTVDDVKSYEALQAEFATSPPALAYLTD
jgi:NDP-sugar pyrophosphorylase family protein